MSFMSSVIGSRALRLAASVACAALLSASSALAASEVSVLHFWTSGGEAKALNILKSDLTSKGVGWKDEPVAGGGGGNAKTVLRARIAAGDPPTAMLMLGQDTIDWAREGLLGNLNDVAAANNWDAVLPKLVQDFVKVDGVYVSVPTNIHRVNMLWASKAAFDKIGAVPPTSWEEFNALAPKFQAAGIVSLAHGGQPWQDLTLFENVLLGVGGVDFYRKALIEGDLAALDSSTMTAVFEQMRRLRGMVDANFSGRDWNLATAMVIRGDAAMQIMGDWAKGEFTAAGKAAGRDFLCVAAPGSAKDFSFLINSFSMFSQTDPGKRQAQAAFANVIMDPANQLAFSVAKGAIPPRRDVPTTGLDSCGQTTAADLVAAQPSNRAVPTFAFGHAAPAAMVGAVSDVVTQHFNSKMSSQDAVKRLATSVKAVR